MPKSKHRRNGRSRPRSVEGVPRCDDCGHPMIPSILLDSPPVELGCYCGASWDLSEGMDCPDCGQPWPGTGLK